jgi:hypothetical protein
MQVFESNLASSRRGGHFAPQIGNLQFEILKRPPYSSDLDPSDYYLLPNLKKHYKGRKVSY